MLVSCTPKNSTSPIPAYGTTRYNVPVNFSESVEKRFIKSPRYAYVGSRSLCTKTNKWPRKSQTTEIGENNNKGSKESSTLTICGNRSHCTCPEPQKEDDVCNCLENKSNTSSESSTNYCVNWKEVYKLTDTSETKLADSNERLTNRLRNCEDLNVFLDLFEPHPRDPRSKQSKDLAPTGYDIQLIVPKCVCLNSFQECQEDDNNDSDEKSGCITNMICMPSISVLSINAIQTEMDTKIPAKYIMDFLRNEELQSVCTDAMPSETKNTIYKETNSDTAFCFHKAFLQKINK